MAKMTDKQQEEEFKKRFGDNPTFNEETCIELLKFCSDVEDTTRWNAWRKANPNVKICLQNINLDNAVLNNIDFQSANLKWSSFINSELKNANLKMSHLEGTQLQGTVLNGADMNSAYLEGANASGAHFIGTNLRAADLSDVILWEVDLENAIFLFSHLEGVQISGEEKKKPNLKNTDFTGAMVNGKTIIQYCDINEKTNFTTVGLDSARIEPELLTVLKTNIRRIRWEKYFKKQGKSCPGKISTAPMRLFWWLSDYGSSSSRIFISIVIAILFFTDLYLICSIETPNGLSFSLDKTNLSEFACIFVRYTCILCFAIATMVTLGFGNINVEIVPGAPGNTIFIFIVVMLNLVLGYLFLSLIVTRFGILFQSPAPQQKLQKKDNIHFYYCAYILFIFGLSYLIIPILYSLNIIYIILFCEIFSLCLYFLLKLLFWFIKFLFFSLVHKIKLYLRFINYKTHKNI